MCRIWAMNDTAVHKALVPSSLCEEDILQTLIDSKFNNNFNYLFTNGTPVASAYCCNWTFCNYNTTFAVLAEPPPEVMSLEDIGLSLQYSKLLLLSTFAFVFKCIL